MKEGEQKIAKSKQLDSISKVLTSFAAALIVILGLKFIAQDLIAPILMAVFLSILLTPIYGFYKKKGFSGGASILFTLLTLVVVVGGLMLFVTFSFNSLKDALSEHTLAFNQTVESVVGNIAVSEEVESGTTGYVTEEKVLNILSAIVGSLGNLVTYLVVVPILAVLILIQTGSIPKDVLKRLLKENPELNNLQKFAESIIIYITGRLKVNLVTGGLFALALVILGVDSPFLWGLLTVLLSFIPYVGLVIAAIPPTFLAFAEGGVGTALVVIASVLLINIFAENVMDPLVQGKGNKISPAIVIVSIIFWGWLLGPVGVILAAPLTVLLKLILSDYRETSWVAQVIEGDYSGIPKKKEGSPSRLKNISKDLGSIFSIRGSKK